MKFTLAQLQNTKAGQDPRNKALIDAAIRAKGSGANILTMGSLGNSDSQPNAPGRALVRKLPPLQKRKIRVALIITIIRFGIRELDDDNFTAGAKPLRDAIATSLGLDDADKRIVWKYQQVMDGGRNGTIVKIDEV